MVTTGAGHRPERLVMARNNIGPPMSLWAVIFLTSGLVLGFAVIIADDDYRRADDLLRRSSS